MQDFEKDFQLIYGSVTGYLIKELRVPWIKCAWDEDTEFNRAFDMFWKAREHLCQRFGIDWEDEDLELFMNGITMLNEDLSRRIFSATVEYAKRGYRLTEKKN